MQELANRAVACIGWRARNGMAFVDPENDWPWRLAGDVVVWDHHGGWPGGPPRDQEMGSIARALPDLRDPATLGCLLALVREAWSDRGLYIQGQYCDGAWRWRVRGSWPHGGTFNRLAAEWHASEAAALVAALEAAP